MYDWLHFVLYCTHELRLCYIMIFEVYVLIVEKDEHGDTVSTESHYIDTYVTGDSP